MRPWKLAEINYGFVKELAYDVAVLPLGATEPHNLHLPYGTDIFEADLVGEKICEAAWNRGAKVVLLPTIPYGTQTNQMQFPLAMNLNPATLSIVLGDLVESLSRHGIQKIVLLNSHGGNDLKPVLRELYDQTPARLFLCNWFTVFKDVYREFSARPTTMPARSRPRSCWPTIPSWSRGTPTAPWRPTKAGRPPRVLTRSIAAGSRSAGPGIS